MNPAEELLLKLSLRRSRNYRDVTFGNPIGQ
jgi:hypothetical protein